MDIALVSRLVDRDWPAFELACQRLAVGTPTRRDATTITVACTPHGSEDRYLAVIECDDYDAQAPLLDFADPDDPTAVGRQWWPLMTAAPYNNVNRPDGGHLPILCVPGTRGYHLHSSHSAEIHDRVIWRLPTTAALLHRLLHRWGPYQGRGR